MIQQNKISVLRAVGNGTIYFLRNIHLVILAFIPVLALNFFFFYNDSKMISSMASGSLPPSFFLFMAINFVIMLWVFNFLVIHIASKPYILNLGIKNQALLALKRMPGAFLTGIMIGVSAMVFSILLIIPGLVLATLWSMVLLNYILFGGVIRSFEEGRELIRGNFWRIFLFFLLLIVITVCLVLGYAYFIGFPSAGVTAGNQIMGLIISLLGSVYYFWVLGLYKELKEAKSFQPDADRKGKSAFYKVILGLSSVGFVLIAVFYVYVFAIMMPKMKARSGMETKIDGNKTTTYVNGLPKSSIEQKEHGISTFTYYDENGHIIREWNLRLFWLVGQEKEYYQDGKIKEIQTYDMGKLNGKSMEYDKKGNLVKTCEYKDGTLLGCKGNKEPGKASK